MRDLKPPQRELLSQIVRRGEVPSWDVDGRVLRPLRAAGLVELSGTLVRATAEGKALVAPPRRAPPPSPVRLNSLQADALRRVLRQGSVAAETLDGRVAKPLLARGLVTIADDVVTPTAAGRVFFDEPAPARTGGRKSGGENPRAAAIRRAVGRLEQAIPKGAEVGVGTILAAAEDVLDGFRAYARKLERRPSA
ncbi:hypothetical protein [Longimicrobium terrae]|uniref:Uncharacterized protein n=1 Tax=Longimicrobium terrae TaxID=1639882 RepID=A0A841GU98_9BACT|nr:hypothetical protein [Longimicrobium terrae]MBB4635903.1 hypothetical protein [Longimicrobium terrae]MBB6070299.1 hypothetical protein [Longimicrobium terrae]NNC30801.1 hypothetical protein [Longimicrobium terrae]